MCTRVAILRGGRLVEIADLADLRRLRRSEVDVSFAAPPPDPAALDGVAGIGEVRWTSPTRVQLSLSGPPGPALAALATGEVTRIDVREPSLEEIFLEYYGDTQP